VYEDARVGADWKMRGGRSVERWTDRRRERGDGPLSLGRRLAGRRGVSDPQAHNEQSSRSGPSGLRRQMIECVARWRRSKAAKAETAEPEEPKESHACNPEVKVKTWPSSTHESPAKYIRAFWLLKRGRGRKDGRGRGAIGKEAF